MSRYIATRAIRGAQGIVAEAEEAVNAALAEYVNRRNRLRVLELAGQIEFDPKWNYKRMRNRK